MAQVIVIHGYTASPEENWYPWFQQLAAEQHFSLNILRLDPSTHPKLSVWTSQIEQQVGRLDENSIVIAHSLGTIAAMHYLSKHLIHQRIQHLVLIAGFNRRLGRLNEVNPFIDAARIDFELLKRQIEHRVVIYSQGDEHVPPKCSIQQAESLDAELIAAEHQGHFIDSEGCTELPEVWQVILPYLIFENQASAKE